MFYAGKIIHIDDNAHHAIWGSLGINQKDKTLFKFIVESKLAVFNRGNEFIVTNRRDVLDITLISNKY